MTLPTEGWKNKGGTSKRSCKCGSWKKHWINASGESWPSHCSVAFCSGIAEVGAHLYNPDVVGEWIAPLCKDCNNDPTSTITLKGGTVLVPANKAKTCEQ